MLVKKELDARNLYRRTADNAYKPLGELLQTLADNDKLEAIGPELKGLPSQFDGKDFEALHELVTDTYNKIRTVEGIGPARSALSKARSALKGRSPDKEKALAAIATAIEEYDTEVAWRQQAATQVMPGLQTYNEAIKDTIGARQQQNLSREQALFLASCSAGHRDVSLSF